jgi:hypothetical protein
MYFLLLIRGFHPRLEFLRLHASLLRCTGDALYQGTPSGVPQSCGTDNGFSRSDFRG